MTTLLRASTPADLLGMIPTLAGFVPRNSLMVVPFRQKRTHGAMRIDLPRDDIPLDEYVAHITALLCRVSDVDGVAFALYDDVPLGQEHLPRHDLALALCDRAAACGFVIFEALCVGPDAWADYLLDSDERHSLDEIVTVTAVDGGPDVDADHHSGTVLPEVSAERRAAVGLALTELRSVLDSRLSGEHHPQAIAAAHLLDDVPEFFERMLHTTNPSPYDLAALAWCLAEPTFGDAALVQWAGTREDGARALGAQVVSCSRGTDSENVMLTLLGQAHRPSATRLQSALHVVRTTAASLDDAESVASLAAAAWLSWALGRSTHAGAYADRALAIDPSDPMAQLVLTLMETTGLPAWAFDLPATAPEEAPTT